jgi:hypothetical protein
MMRRVRGSYLLLVLVGCGAIGCAARAGGRSTELAIRGTGFTIDGKPTFLLGCSYFAGLGASEENVRADLDELQCHGFKWIRVWATWTAFDNDVSAVDSDGRARQPYLDRLRWLVGECDGRGMVVDVTLSRGDGGRSSPRLAGIEAHRQAVRTVAEALKDRRNWFIDLSTERNVRDKRFTSIADLRALRDVVKSIDPKRLVTASHSGALTAEEQAQYVREAGLEFIALHAERDAESPGKTRGRTERILASFPAGDARVPLVYDEPFRRGYGKWEPRAEDFAADLAGARAGGAAGWCFHNGAEGSSADHRPARSFDLRGRRLFEQWDAEERKFLERLVEGRER